MSGPAPKHPSARARRNKTSTRATLSPVHDVEAPKLPSRPDGWHEMTVQWWADIWASPMSPEWDESDVHNVYLLAMIYDDIWTAEGARERAQAASEYRQQRKDLGLTPFDRRRLEWTIEQADEARDKGDRRRSSAPRQESPKGGKPDPRSTLRAG